VRPQFGRLIIVVFASLLVAFLVGGCGPLAVPMVQRLTPSEQKEVDSIWRNMLQPVDRTDPPTLMDCLIVYQLYHRGVDSFHARSVKQTPSGKVTMTIDFDRDRPSDDRFTFKLTRWGFTIREEQWSGNQVFQAIQQLAGQQQVTQQGQQPSPTSQPSPEAVEQLERRWKRLAAATQPAGSLPNDEHHE